MNEKTVGEPPKWVPCHVLHSITRTEVNSVERRTDDTWTCGVHNEGDECAIGVLVALRAKLAESEAALKRNDDLWRREKEAWARTNDILGEAAARTARWEGIADTEKARADAAETKLDGIREVLDQV